MYTFTFTFSCLGFSSIGELNAEETKTQCKRKTRDIWATHQVTRNTHQLYTLLSFIFTQKIRFAQPNGDFIFIQTSSFNKWIFV